MAKAAAAADGFSGRMNSIGSKMTSVGATVTKTLTLPIVGVGLAAADMAMKFDSSMELIHTQAGASQAEVDKMTKSVTALVESGKSFGQSADDMSKALFFIESEGIRGADALNILKVSAAGAAVGQTDLAQTSNALTSAMKVFKVPAADAAQTMATLNAVVGTGKMHFEDLNASLSTKFFPTAKQLGVSLAQAGAALDVFTQAGIPANVAANNLTTSLIKIEAPSKAGAKALADMGLSSTQLAQALQTGGLPDALKLLKDAYDKVAESQGKVAANQDIFAAFGGSHGGAPVLALIQQYDGYLKDLGNIQKQNSPKTFWADVASTMGEPQEKIKSAMASLGASMIQIGQSIAPAVARIAQSIAGLAQWFDRLSPATKKLIEVGAGIVAALGPAVSIIGNVTKALGGMGTAIKWIRENPLDSAAFAGVLAVAGLVADAAIQLRAKWQSAADAFNNARDAILGLKDSLDKLKGSQQGVTQASIDLMSARTRLNEAEKAWAQIITDGKTKTDAGREAYVALKQAQLDVKTASDQLTSAHKAEVAQEQARAQATQRLSGQVDELAQRLGKIIGLKDPIDQFMGGKLWNPSTWTSLGDAIEHPVQAFEGFLESTSKAQDIQTAATKLFSLADAAKATANNLASSDPKMAEAARKISDYSAAIGILIDKYGKIPSKKEIVAEIKLMKAQGWDQQFAAIINQAKQAGDRSSAGFGTGISKLPAEAAKALGGVTKTLAGFDGEAFSKAFGIGSSLDEGVVAGIAAKAGAVTAAAADVVTRAVAAALNAAGNPHSPAPVTIPIGEDWSEGLAYGITGGWAYVEEAVNGVFTKLKQTVTGKSQDAWSGMGRQWQQLAFQYGPAVASAIEGANQAYVNMTPELLHFDAVTEKINAGLKTETGLLQQLHGAMKQLSQDEQLVNGFIGGLITQSGNWIDKLKQLYQWNQMLAAGLQNMAAMAASAVAALKGLGESAGQVMANTLTAQITGQPLPTTPSPTVLATLVSSVPSSVGSGFHGVQLAGGGIVTRPTIALIGEKGPEAVVPLGSGSSAGVHVHFHGGTFIGARPDDVARDLAPALVRQLNIVNRRYGA